MAKALYSMKLLIIFMDEPPFIFMAWRLVQGGGGSRKAMCTHPCCILSSLTKSKYMERSRAFMNCHAHYLKCDKIQKIMCVKHKKQRRVCLLIITLNITQRFFFKLKMSTTQIFPLAPIAVLSFWDSDFIQYLKKLYYKARMPQHYPSEQFFTHK